MRKSRVQSKSAALAAAVVGASALSAPARGQLASFAGAQGFGGDATGGRAGSIYVVTNLNDSGAGSFRDAVSHSNRIIVFAVSGYIDLQSAVSCSSNLTILGQTAPGQGIGLQGQEVSFSDQSNVILQYMKFRQGSGGDSSQNSLALGNTNNVIVDHCSVEYGLYNNIDATGTNGSANLTIQNSIIADPIKGQQFNMHTEGSNTTYLNNLWANAHNRNPLAKSNSQYVNNVVYNYQAGFTTGDSSGAFTYDVLNNYFIAGPSTSSSGDDFYQVDSTQSAYLSGNYLDSNKDGKLNGSIDSTADGASTLAAEWSPETQFLPTLTAAQAYAFTLAHSGAMYNSSGGFAHDQLDAQTVTQVSSLGTAGVIYNSENTADPNLSTGGVGFGTLTQANNSSGTIDTVPTGWMTAHGLSTANANGLLLLNPLGYRMIEQYAQEAQDQYATQVASTGEWNTAAWTSATPGIYDHAQIRGTGLANGAVTISGSDAASAFTVSVGGNGPAGGEALYVSGGSLTVQDTIYLGDRNNGTLALSGGTVRANNLQLGNTVYDANGNPTSYTGTFNFTGGTLQVGQVVLGAGTPGSYTGGGNWNWNGGTLQAFGTLNVNAPATLTGNGATVNTVGPDGLTYAGTMSGVLGGTGGLTKIGAGALTLSAVNTYSGPTNIAAGSIVAAVTNAIGAGSTIKITGGGALLQLNDGVTISSPIVVGGGTASEFADAPGTANATLAGPISLSGSAQFRVGDSGTGTLTYTGTSTSTTSYTFITKGNITYGSGGVLNETSSSGGITLGRSATQAVNVVVTGTGSAINVTKVAAGGTGITLGSGSTSYENPTVTLTVASGGAVNVGPAYVNVDADPTTATGAIATLNLNGGGTLTTGGFTDAEATVNAAVLNLNGGTIVAGGSDPSGSTFLPAFAKLTAAVGSGGAVVNDGGFSITLAQPLTTGVTSGTDGGLTKSGAGTVTLSVANTFTGPTKVTAGTLRVNNTTGSGTGTGAVTVNSGATLGGGGTISGAVTVAGTIAPGATDSAVGTLTTGGETWSTGGALAAQLSSSGGSLSGNDKLALSSLNVAALTTAKSFGVQVSVLGTDTPTLPVGTSLILVNDKDTSASSDPFASSAILSKLSLSASGVQAPTGYALALATQADPTSGSGYDLVLTDVAATPEPTSLLLAAFAAVPLVVGRRRRSV